MPVTRNTAQAVGWNEGPLRARFYNGWRKTCANTQTCACRMHFVLLHGAPKVREALHQKRTAQCPDLDAGSHPQCHPSNECARRACPSNRETLIAFVGRWSTGFDRKV